MKLPWCQVFAWLEVSGPPCLVLHEPDTTTSYNYVIFSQEISWTHLTILRPAWCCNSRDSMRQLSGATSGGPLLCFSRATRGGPRQRRSTGAARRRHQDHWTGTTWPRGLVRWLVTMNWVLDRVESMSIAVVFICEGLWRHTKHSPLYQWVEAMVSQFLNLNPKLCCLIPPCTIDLSPGRSCHWSDRQPRAVWLNPGVEEHHLLYKLGKLRRHVVAKGTCTHHPRYARAVAAIQQPLRGCPMVVPWLFPHL